MNTQRPQNICHICGHTWYPKGKNRAPRCPNCGKTNVGLVREMVRNAPVSKSGFGWGKLILWLGVLSVLACGGCFAVVGRLFSPSKSPIKPGSAPAASTDPKSTTPIEASAPTAQEEAEQPASDAKLRTWKSLDGKFSAEARYIGVVRDHVLLRRTNGKTITVPLDTLSAEDMQFIEDFRKALKK